MLTRVVLQSASSTLSELLAKALPERHVHLLAGADAAALWHRLRSEPCDLLLIDRARIPAPSEEFFARLGELTPRPRVIVLGEARGPEDLARLLSWGAMAVLPLAVPDGLLNSALGSLAALAEGAARSEPTHAEGPRFVSPTMDRLVDSIQRVAAVDSTLLILGETGVGKEHLARSIHAASARARGPFEPINCAALPATLFESELFGHRRGAFTGADKPRRGIFEQAHGGTILLDEVGDIPIELQPKLLRAIEERRIRPIGAATSIAVDVRVMAATNLDLAQQIERGLFRRDLYYRLAVFELAIPPLRERRGEIPDLVASQIARLAPTLRSAVRSVTPAALERLVAYAWPGNVRELINVIERALLLCDAAVIDVPHLPHALREPRPGSRTGADARVDTLETLFAARDRRYADFEQRYLEALLTETRGRIAETAKRAGIAPRVLYEKMRRFGLRKEDFKVAAH